MTQKSGRRGVAQAIWGSSYLWLLAGCALTLLVMLSYPQLPEKRLQLVHENTVAYIYSDSKNVAEWVNIQALHWRCRIQDAHDSAFCGLHFALGGEDQHGLDFSRYDRIELDLSYSGASRSFRYYVRNREPGFSERENLDTHKFIHTQISVDFIPDGLAIGLDEFYVAEWWLSAFNVPRELSGPSFNHVTALGIELAYPAAGGNHETRLHSVELVGDWVSREQLYAAIIVVWVIALSAFGSYRLFDLRRRVLRERERSERVMQRNLELRQQSQQYRAMSEQDQLTGLLNRHGVTRAIETLFSDPGNAVGLLVIDIDRFKPVNDTYGHTVGDQILRQMGDVLSECVRQSDYLARWGGEEFVLLLPGAVKEETAANVAEKLRHCVANTQFEALPEGSLTVSIGVGDRQAGEGYHTLFRRVDLALYRAKEAGRNRVEMAD